MSQREIIDKEIIERIIEASITQGYFYLYSSGYSVFDHELLEYIHLIAEDSNYSKLFLVALDEYFSEKISRAKSILEKDDLIFSDLDDENSELILSAFHNFDDLIYFYEFVEREIREKYKEFANQIFQILDKYLNDINEWLDYSSFSPLRLTVFNEIRNKKLSEIPVEKRYLFPWYELYSNFDQDIILDIIENFESFKSLDIQKLDQISGQQILILKELHRDRELYYKLREFNILHERLKSYFSKPNPFLLWHLSNETEMDHILPESVSRTGIIRANVELIKNVLPKIKNEQQRTFWLFMIAFNAPVLKHSKRIDLFSQVIKNIKKMSISEEDTDVVNILHLIQRWYNGENVEVYLAEKAFKFWSRELENISNMLGEFEKDVDASELIKIINKLEDLNLAPLAKLKYFWLRILDQISKNSEKKRMLFPQRATMSHGKIELIVQNPIEFKVKKTDKVNLFPDESELSERSEPYLQLRRKLKNIRGLYWIAFFILDESIEPIVPEPKEIYVEPLYIVDNIKSDLILIVISEEREQLKDLIHKLLSEIETNKTISDELIDELAKKFIFLKLTIKHD